MNSDLYDVLIRLLPAQFSEVVFRLGVPSAYLPGAGAPQAQRAVSLMEYLRNAQRLGELRALLERMRVLRDGGTPTSGSGGSGSGGPKWGELSLKDPKLRKDIRGEVLRVVSQGSDLRVYISDAGVQSHRLNLSGSLEVQVNNLLIHLRAMGEPLTVSFLTIIREEYPEAELPAIDALLESLTGRAPSPGPQGPGSVPPGSGEAQDPPPKPPAGPSLKKGRTRLKLGKELVEQTQTVARFKVVVANSDLPTDEFHWGQGLRGVVDEFVISLSTMKPEVIKNFLEVVSESFPKAHLPTVDSLLGSFEA